MPTPLLSVPAEAASLPKSFLFLLPTCPWLLPPHSSSYVSLYNTIPALYYQRFKPSCLFGLPALSLVWQPAACLWNQLHPSSLPRIPSGPTPPRCPSCPLFSPTPNPCLLVPPLFVTRLTPFQPGSTLIAPDVRCPP